MACNNVMPEVTKRLATEQSGSSNPVYDPFTAWIPAIGVDVVKLVIKLKSVSTKGGGSETFNVKPAVQVAKVRTDNPEAWQVIGSDEFSSSGAADNCTGDESLVTPTPITPGALYVRFGVAYYLGGTGGTHGQADVSVQVSYTACGHIVGSRTAQFQTDSTSELFEPMTPWLPAIGVDKFKAAFVMTSAGSQFRYAFAFRKATALVESPSAWDSSLMSFRSGTGADGAQTDEVNSGELTPSPALTSNMWVQLGIVYKSNTSGTMAKATMTGVYCVRKS